MGMASTTTGESYVTMPTAGMHFLPTRIKWTAFRNLETTGLAARTLSYRPTLCSSSYPRIVYKAAERVFIRGKDVPTAQREASAKIAILPKEPIRERRRH